MLAISNPLNLAHLFSYIILFHILFYIIYLFLT